MVSPVESFWLKWHARHDAPSTARRARIILLAENGIPPLSIAKRLKTTPATVTRVLREFQNNRLTAFPQPVLSVPQLLKAARVNPAHARYVTAASIQLFHILELSYRLPANLLPTLQTAAVLHDVGMNIDEANHHIAGRDMMNHVQLRGVPKSQQRVIACLVRFHRKRVLPDEESLFSALSSVWRQRTLQLAAILRVADGLDYSQTQSTRIENSVSSPEAIQLDLSGPQASSDGKRARRKADLWETVFHIPFSPKQIIHPPDLAQLQNQILAIDSPLSVSIQRMIAKQMLRWQIHESAMLAGDPEGIKAIRSSIRRIRKTLELAEGYVRKKVSKKLLRPIRNLESMLGKVRDLDLLILDAKKYLADHPAVPSANSETEFPVISIWEQEQREAQTVLVEWFSERASRKLQAELFTFLANPSMRKDPLLGIAITGYFKDALNEIKDRQANLKKDELKTYHRMRLALRQFRFTLEFCGEALGPTAEELRTDIGKVQKRLGLISDAWLIQQKTAELLDLWAEQQALQNAPQLHGAQPILEYAQARRNQLSKLTRGISKDCEPVRYAKLSRRIKVILASAMKAPPAAPIPGG
jgi:CHAD domain-containing protein